MRDGIAKLRWQLLAAGLFVVSGCVSPQKLQKARTDISNLSTEQRERDIEQRCIDAGAMPGTDANLECRLGLNKTPPQAPPAP